ncbi:ATP-grasp domain-containing protein [Streptomyces sp. NPDC003023]|uniref:ATP-grasp domain-containing protein n=1 Tax=Streptomyces sp. NPDC003023 TaxID=3364675 RepID=UPI0036A57B69
MAIAVIETLNFGLGYLAEAARTRGHDLYLLTTDRSFYRHELGSGRAAEVHVVDVDTSNVDELVAKLREIPGLAGIVRMTDLWSMPALAAAEALGLPCQDREAVALLRNKARLRNALHEKGLSRAPSILLDPHTDVAQAEYESMPMPCIVKDVAGSSSQNVWLAKYPADLPRILHEARQVDEVRGGALTVEPYFVGPLYSAETLSFEGEMRILGINSRSLSPEPYFREDALSFPVSFPEDQAKELQDWLSSILASAGYSEGFTHTEFIVTSEGLEIVEVNPRLGGGMIGECIRQSLDVDVHGAFIDLALGERPALMDIPLDVERGTAQILIYPSHTGVFDHFTGEDLLAHHPGDPRLYPLKRPGDPVPSTTDQRGAVAILFCTGATAELALHNAMSAVGKVGVHVRREDQR